jgi:hypothetical protein
VVAEAIKPQIELLLPVEPVVRQRAETLTTLVALVVVPVRDFLMLGLLVAADLSVFLVRPMPLEPLLWFKKRMLQQVVQA